MQSLVWLMAASGMLADPLSPPESAAVIAARGPVLPAMFAPYRPAFAPAPPQRPKAVELSNRYYTRVAIHRYASYATLPLFVTEYAIGRSLYNRTTESESLRSWHTATATGIYALFAVNTVTGVWNLWEGRAVKQGRARRYVHSALMLASGAGFVATAMLAPDDDEGGGGAVDTSRRRTHRTVAIASMSTALLGDLMMLLWNDK
jgi:hypothetical protein